MSLSEGVYVFALPWPAFLINIFLFLHRLVLRAGRHPRLECFSFPGTSSISIALASSVFLLVPYVLSAEVLRNHFEVMSDIVSVEVCNTEV